MECVQCTKSMRTNLQTILKSSQGANSNPIDSSPQVNGTDVAALCGATPHSTETPLSPKIHTVIKIYIILIVPCFWSRLHSDKLPFPRLWHPAVTFNLQPSTHLHSVVSAIPELSSAWVTPFKKMWHTWASIYESGPFIWAIPYMPYHILPYMSWQQKKSNVWCVCLLTYKTFFPSTKYVPTGSPTSRGTCSRRLNATNAGCAMIRVSSAAVDQGEHSLWPTLSSATR